MKIMSELAGLGIVDEYGHGYRMKGNTLNASGVAHCPVNEVPEKLAVQDGPEGCPYSIWAVNVSANTEEGGLVYAQTLAVTETRRLYSCQTRLPISNEK